MSHDVKVPWKRRLGDIAEDEIDKRLKLFSLPAKFTGTSDIGIDFYCQLLENDIPSNTHFFVQAKGTEHFDKHWGKGIKKSTVKLWLQQPFPVFLIVYDRNDGNCYWMSIEDHRISLLKKLSEKNTDTIYIKMDRSNVLNDVSNGNDDFIKKIEGDIKSLELFSGRPTFKGKEYVKAIPEAPRLEIELIRIKENVRAYLYSLIAYHWRIGSLLGSQRDLETARLYCDFLTKFDKSHYNHFVWFGQLSKAFGRVEQARWGFQEALKIFEKDKIWPRDSKEKIVAYIKKELENLG